MTLLRYAFVSVSVFIALHLISLSVVLYRLSLVSPRPRN